MANGSSSEWTEIDKLRAVASENRARIAVLEAEVGTLKGAISASESRIVKRIDDHEEATNARFDRGRNIFLTVAAIAVPLVSAIVGALLQSGAG